MKDVFKALDGARSVFEKHFDRWEMLLGKGTSLSAPYGKAMCDNLRARMDGHLAAMNYVAYREAEPYLPEGHQQRMPGDSKVDALMKTLWMGSIFGQINTFAQNPDLNDTGTLQRWFVRAADPHDKIFHEACGDFEKLMDESIVELGYGVYEEDNGKFRLVAPSSGRAA